MSPPDPREVTKAYAAIKRHRPTRAKWAEQLVRGSWLSCLQNICVICCVALIPSMSFAFIVYVEYPTAGAVLAWLGALFAATGALCFLVLHKSASRNVLDMSTMSTIEAGVILGYVQQCSHMKKAVLAWLDQTNDGMLSPYQFSLLKNAARAKQIRPGNSCIFTHTVLDDEFYRIFPSAPVFKETEQHLASDFSCSVAQIDAAVGHISRTRCRRLHEQIDKGCSESAPKGPTTTPHQRF